MATRAKELSDLGNSGHLNVHDDGTVTLEGGNIGIGTNNPGTVLHVNAVNPPSGIMAKFVSNGNPWIQRVGGGGSWQTGVTTNGYEFYNDTNSLYNVVISPGGSIGIGTRSPSNKLTIDIPQNNSGITLSDHGDGFFPQIIYNSNRSSAGQGLGKFSSLWNGTEVARIEFAAGTDATNKDDGAILFNTKQSGASLSTKVRIETNGNVGIGTTSPGEKLDVNGTIRSIGNNNANYSASLVGRYDSTHSLALYTRINSSTNSEILGVYASSGGAAPRTVINPSNGWNVGIGIQSPMSQLHVNKDVAGHNTNGITIGKVEANGWIDTNEEMGRLSWSASYGSSYTPGIGAYISAKADANWDGNETPTRLGFFTAPESSTTPVERMRIDSSGNVGIGNNSPSSMYTTANNLVIGDSGNSGITIKSTGGIGAISFADGVNGSERYRGQIAYSHSGDSLRFNTAAGERMRIQSDGAVVIKPNGITTGLRLQGRSSDNNFYIQFKSNDGSATYSSIGTESATSGILFNSDIHRFNSTSSATEYMRITSSGNVGIGTNDPSRPLEIVASTGANALRLRARSNDDYAFIQFSNYAGTTLRGQIYSHQTTGSIGFTTGTDSSAGDDLYISDSGGVGINTTTTGGYNGRLTVYQDTHDAYTPNSFLDKPTMQLRHTANINGYTGTRYANNTGTYEWFTGAHQKNASPGAADFVTQGYNRQVSGYREFQRIYDTGQIVQPQQPSFIAHKTSHLALSGAGQLEAGGWSTSHVNGAHNVGGCFNTSTGRFTVPVAGRYKFDANIMHGKTSGDFQIWLCVNGNTSTCVRSNSMQSAGGNWKQTTVTGIFNLAASDYISIFVRSSLAEQYAMYGSSTAAFTTCNGYLIG